MPGCRTVALRVPGGYPQAGATLVAASIRQTSARSLFNRAGRAPSSACARVVHEIRRLGWRKMNAYPQLLAVPDRAGPLAAGNKMLHNRRARQDRRGVAAWTRRAPCRPSNPPWWTSRGCSRHRDGLDRPTAMGPYGLGRRGARRTLRCPEPGGSNRSNFVVTHTLSAPKGPERARTSKRAGPG